MGQKIPTDKQTKKKQEPETRHCKGSVCSESSHKDRHGRREYTTAVTTVELVDEVVCYRFNPVDEKCSQMKCLTHI